MEECGIFGKPLHRSREGDFLRFHCTQCKIPRYAYAPAEPPRPIRERQKPEKPSVFSLLFPVTLIAFLELLYHLLA